jgi:hypothetical protein
MPTCRHCSQAYEIPPEDLAFYEKASPVFREKKELILPPTLCVDCRFREMFTWRNDRRLFHRKCDLTGKQIISIYPADIPFTVYEQHSWWGDDWNALDYGRAYDPKKPFFEQFSSLLRTVPIPSLHTESCENAEYGCFNWAVKDSYLVFASDKCEDCYYCHLLFGCKDCADCAFSKECERCYELLDSERCYRCFYSKELTNCSYTDFSFDCRNCNHCFGCAGLRNKEYHMFNEPVPKGEYDRKLKELTITDASIRLAKERAMALWEQLPRLAAKLVQCEDSTGDNLLRCKHCRECFDGVEGEDCTRVQNIPGNTKDCMELYGTGYGAELSYRGVNIAAQRTLFSLLIYPSGSDILYSSFCGSCRDVFGCVSLKHRQYCILNTQYTKEEYETLVPKIIEQMRKANEWGEYFPASISPFAYNETLAQEYFPLTKQGAEKMGWRWADDRESEHQYLGPTHDVPEDIRQAGDDITKQILRCEVTKKPYKIIPQELAFYRELGIPIPRKCPDQRHRERMALRNPRKTWERQCAKCKKPIVTSYAPERPESVLCEPCYLATVY